MTREEYDLGGWLILGYYVTDSGEQRAYWAQTYAGIERAAQARRSRITAARNRREQDDEWSNHIARMVDE
jgi:hypothetical protein